MTRTIYADHAATTPLDPDALKAMLPYLTDLYGNPSAPYGAAGSVGAAVAQARRTIAECIGADPDEIYFTSGGTEADNWVIHGTEGAVAVSAIEHHAVLSPCAAAQRQGRIIIPIPATAEGIVTAEAVKNSLTPDVKLVSVMAANNELGTIQPIAALVEVAHRHGALFHTDAVAAVGRLPLDVKALDVDFLSASAHKFGGPKGIGFLYIKKGTAIAPLLYGGTQENGLRAGTENVAAIIGMAVALRNAVSHLASRRTHLERLTALFLDGLQAAGIPFIRHGGTDTLPGYVSLAFPSMAAENLLHRLDLQGIRVSTKAACDGKDTATSHVLQAIGMSEEIAASTIRVSFGHTNTEADVTAFITALQSIFTP